MNKNIFKVSLILLLAFGITSASFAQGRQTGSISGTVSDEEGNLLPGVTVTLTGSGIMGNLTSFTGETGRFRFPSLIPGEYEIKAEVAGFITAIRKGLRVQAGKTTDVHIIFTITTIEEQVIVAVEPPWSDPFWPFINWDALVFQTMTLGMANEDFYNMEVNSNGVSVYTTYKKKNLTFKGTATPNSKIIISWVHTIPANNWNVAGDTIADNNGNWSLELNLLPGHYIIISPGAPTINLDVKQALIITAMDGASDSGNIFELAKAAAANQSIVLEKGHNYEEMDSSFTGFGVDEVDTGMHIINELAATFETYGIGKSDIKLVMVGKSLGAAKSYKMLYKFAYDINDYEKVAVVLVDAHCVPPSDEGDGGWNNYVYFTGSSGDYNSTYNMAWQERWTSAFNSSDAQSYANNKLRIYNIYSRRCYKRLPSGFPFWGICMKVASILGYKFTSAYRNLHAMDWNGYSYNGNTYINNQVYNLNSGTYQAVTHFNIDKARETRNLIEEAIIGVLETSDVSH